MNEIDYGMKGMFCFDTVKKAWFVWKCVQILKDFFDDRIFPLKDLPQIRCQLKQGPCIRTEEIMLGSWTNTV